MRQLDTGQGVTGQNDPVDLKAVQELTDVFHQGVDVIAGFRVVRIAMPAPVEAQDAKLTGEAWGKVIEDVGVAASASQNSSVCPLPPQSR